MCILYIQVVGDGGESMCACAPGASAGQRHQPTVIPLESPSDCSPVFLPLTLPLLFVLFPPEAQISVFKAKILAPPHPPQPQHTEEWKLIVLSFLVNTPNI